jgi:hypothetical protein
MARTHCRPLCLESLEERRTPSAGLTPNESFVQALYGDLLGRSGSTAELDYWANQLPTLGQQGVVQSITHSAETEGHFVDGIYAQMLGRGADADGRSYWVNYLANGGTLEGMIGGFAGSAEFAARANILVGGSDTNANLVEALYGLLLHRAANPSEESYWTGVLSSQSATAVGQGIATSQEFRMAAVRTFYGDPTQAPLPAEPYLPDLLFRTSQPSPNEINPWVNSSTDLLTIATQIAGSGEYFNVRTR